jgi:hypothetical protein
MIAILLEPPYGVREGLIPLLIAAGLKAFPMAISIQYRGRFVDDLLPSVIEDIVKAPDDYRLDVVGLSAQEERYLAGVLDLFAPEGRPKEPQGDLLRACMDAVLEWRHRLPAAAAESRYLSEGARAFDKELASPDPVRLFLHEVPRLVGVAPSKRKKLLEAVAELRDELGGIERVFEQEAVQAVQQTLVSRGIRNGAGVREQAARWAAHFPKAFGRRLPDRVAQGVLSRLRAPYQDDGSLVNALSTLLVGKPIRQWDDSVVPSFRRQLRSAFELIESTALGLSESPELDAELRDGLTALAEAQITTIAVRLGDIVGGDQAAAALEAIAAELRSHHVPAEKGRSR